MGQTCAPANNGDRPVKDTDAQDVKEAESGNKADQAHLIDILNSYTAKNEELEKENADLKAKATGGADKNVIQSELERMKALLAQKDKELEEKEEMLQKDADRIAKLKLQSELREQEAKILTDSHKAATLIEGPLLKFGKAGKGKPKSKKVEVMEKPGEKIENGWAPGQLLLVYADDEKATEMTRAHVTKVIDGADFVSDKQFKERTFSLETQPNNKVIAFAAEDKETRDGWYQTINDALLKFVKENKEMNETFSFTMEFKERPLGFRVEERFLTGDDGKQKEVLMVTKIQETHEHLRKDGLTEGLCVTSCNETDFAPLKYPEKLEIIKGVEYPMKLTLEGKKWLRADDGAENTHRDMTMRLLYPELFRALTTDGSDTREELYKHPLVQQNPEIKKWLDRPDFKELLTELMSDPEKLRDFLMNKKL